MKSHALTSILAVLALAAAPSLGTAQTNIFPASGSVGIGTTSPAVKLDVIDTTPVTSAYFIGISSPSQGVLLRNSGNTGELNMITFSTLSSTIGFGRIAAWRTSSGSYLSFGTSNNYATGITNQALTIDYNGKVGIGTTTPYAILEVVNPASSSSGTEVARFTAPTSSGTPGTGPFITFGNTGHYLVGKIYCPLVNGSQIDMAFSAYSGSVAEVMRLAAGKVGIGTTAPDKLLTVSAAGTGSDAVLLKVMGSTTNAFPSIEVDRPQNNRTASINFSTNSDLDWSIGTKYNGGAADFGFGIGTDNHLSNAVFYISTAGYVGIGTIAPTCPLTVNGTIRAKEVIVDTGWSDYVFAPEHRLAPLTEVEAAIKADHHLPGIPSQGEVAAKGVSVGEMQAKLLEKVEELTLYVIAQDKRVAAQDKRIEKLEEENRSLRAAR